MVAHSSWHEGLEPEHFPEWADSLVLRAGTPDDWRAIAWLDANAVLPGRSDVVSSPTISVGADRGERFGPDDGVEDEIWVAQVEGEVVGMVSIGRPARSVIHVRKIRVAREWQYRHLGRQLIGLVVRLAKESDCLKVVLHDSSGNAHCATKFVASQGFNFAGSRHLNGHTLLEFYTDLYGSSRPPKADHADSHESAHLPGAANGEAVDLISRRKH
jgi:GNAT superfamily N-acetyltransferase